ncbi:hypothetical protein [Proteiniphilum acetatigenes]|uniref:hypothetical protein n=1 Tax=Proteiniphilum acetatigenes TaxID=294710 RepID=UPI000361E63E|nr:hypothetical protein [Proteiniphilum acetatigenes]SFL50062.1 hypothetical protein SAMN05216357_12559 [Porphyromonadaceae bacterium KH3CP3RA]
MKSTKVVYLSLFVCFTLLSCEKEPIDTPAPEVEPQIFTYVYTNQHETKDFNVYVGPEGQKIPYSIDNASHFWGEYSSLGQPYYDTLVVDTKNDSIYLKHQYSSISQELTISSDTLKYSADGMLYWGFFVGDSTFIMNRAHYFIHYDGRKTDWNPYSHIGAYGYWRYHEEARMNEFFHKNARFRNLQDMTLPSDTIAWLTEYYHFKLVETK